MDLCTIIVAITIVAYALIVIAIIYVRQFLLHQINRSDIYETVLELCGAL